MRSSRRIRIRLEFEGTDFCGWQVQKQEQELSAGHGRSIQRVIEEAFSTVLHLKERLLVQGCSRTDAGVHAEEFFAHLDIPEPFSLGDEELERLRHSMNCLLPESIVITHVKAVGQDFHAIESALSKTYKYQVLLRRAKPTLLRHRCLWLPLEPKEEYFSFALLEQGLKLLEGTHDFASFMAAHGSAKTTVRTLSSCRVLSQELGDAAESGLLVSLEFNGTGFLKQMVRNMVGTLLELAQRRRTLASLSQLLAKPGARTEAGFCAPAEGLFLQRVHYSL